MRETPVKGKSGCTHGNPQWFEPPEYCEQQDGEGGRRFKPARGVGAFKEEKRGRRRGVGGGGDQPSHKYESHGELVSTVASNTPREGRIGWGDCLDESGSPHSGGRKWY